MTDRDSCITAVKDYLIENDRIMKDFYSRYDSAEAEKKRITDLNERKQKEHATARAVYLKGIQDKTHDDHANFTNCGSNPDPTKWAYITWRRSHGDLSNRVCIYRYTDAEINRLMNVWNDEHKIIPIDIPSLPVPPTNTATINCCNNQINLSDSNVAKDALNRVEQRCNQSIDIKNGGGGGGGGGGDTNNNPDSKVITTDTTDTTSIDEKENNNKLIIIIIICIIFLLGMGLTAYFIYNNSKKK